MDAKEIIKDVTEKIQKNANARAIFGDPVEKGELTVIPVSKVKIFGCGGGGMGEGGECGENGDGDQKKNKGRGMGLSIKVKAVPVGYIEINKEDAHFFEITDRSRIITAGIGLSAFAIFSLTRLLMKLLKK